MLTFKKIDWVAQLLMISIGLIMNVMVNRGFQSNNFFLPYLMTGSWQLLSVVIHFFFPKETRSPLRNIYLILLLLTLLAAAVMIAIDNDSILMFLFGMLFWTPLLAIFYLFICYKETMRLKKEEIAS